MITSIFWDWSGTIVNELDSLNPIAIKIIQKAHKKHLIQGIVTNGERKSIIARLKLLAIDQYFLSSSAAINLICRSDGFPLKPAPDMLVALIERIGGIKPKEVIFIGDSSVDSEMAKNYGCRFININDINTQNMELLLPLLAS